MHECFVCNNKTERFDTTFGAGFCEGDYCIRQMELGWGSMANARIFYRSLWSNPDGTPRKTPKNIIVGVRPATKEYYSEVDAIKYRK